MSFLKRLFGGGKKQEKPPPEQRQAPKPRLRSKPDFPLGDNIVDDPDVKTFADLARYYPLPEGFEYQQTEAGVPEVVRVGHDERYKFLIEADMLTFDKPYTRKDGRIGYKTTEVIKRSRT
jgi:hypothetical protein